MQQLLCVITPGSFIYILNQKKSRCKVNRENQDFWISRYPSEAFTMVDQCKERFICRSLYHKTNWNQSPKIIFKWGLQIGHFEKSKLCLMAWTWRISTSPPCQLFQWYNRHALLKYEGYCEGFVCQQAIAGFNLNILIKQRIRLKCLCFPVVRCKH